MIGMFIGTACTDETDPWIHPAVGVASVCELCALNDINFQSFAADGQALKAAVDEYLKAGWNFPFTNAAQTYGYDVRDWDVKDVQDFSWLFAFTNFNQDLSKWRVSQATDMVRILVQFLSWKATMDSTNVNPSSSSLS